MVCKLPICRFLYSIFPSSISNPINSQSLFFIGGSNVYDVYDFSMVILCPFPVILNPPFMMVVRQINLQKRHVTYFMLCSVMSFLSHLSALPCLTRNICIHVFSATNFKSYVGCTCLVVCQSYDWRHPSPLSTHLYVFLCKGGLFYFNLECL